MFRRCVVIWIGLLSLSAVVCRAERQLFAGHVVNTMFPAGTMTCVSPFTVATTAELTYTFSGTGAMLGPDHLTQSKYVFLLPKNDCELVITPAIDELVGLQIFHYPLSKCTNIKVYASEDGEWGDPLSGDAIEYKSTGSIEVTVPRDTYYLKIANSANSGFSILSIYYYTEHCNCFRYRP